jgi:predicted anti-sigma-YlaC factor YlaD
MQFAPTDCARARESVSARLDGELPELELDRLETHLRFCPACAGWAEDVRDLTLRLRDADLLAPAEPLVLHHGSRRRWAVSSAVALASAAAVVATMFVAPKHEVGTSQNHVQQLSRFASPALQQHFVVSRMQRLEDGMFPPAATTENSFRHV